MKTHRWILSGQVQGVGFRPFVYRLATALQLSGWVKNQLGQVEIVAQGSPIHLTQFANDLLTKAPTLAKPQIVLYQSIKMPVLPEFQILPSKATNEAIIHIPPDYAPCTDCLQEFSDPAERRYHYPFINCTQCGPRFTIINRLPYDRSNTSMAGFPLCAACQAEYENPGDRRFHAEPVACPVCGPTLEFQARDVQKKSLGETSEIFRQREEINICVQVLRAGEIVAVKGIGGYHLMCDANNDTVVKRLRNLKPRPHKPLAVLFPDDNTKDLASLKSYVVLTKPQIQWLRHTMRPIVLVNRAPKNSEKELSHDIAPGLAEVGIMLPGNPLHVLLMATFGGPLVATSANVSGEPILIEAVDVERRLGHITSSFLHHNRPIVRPVDDSVFRFIQDSSRPLRLGRGCAPLELTLPFELAQPTLAVGGQTKNTVALGWQNRVVISAHIGDLGSPRSQTIFTQVINDLQTLYGVQAKQLVCDAHPHYRSSRWARETGLPVTKIYHHHAHASAVAGEFASTSSWLVFTWDGVGLGEDGTLWGGEALYGQPGHWQRVGTLRSFALPGGEKASRELWRSALGLGWEMKYHWKAFEKKADYDLLYQAWKRQLNCPRTSAVGRLFDAAAAFTQLVQTTTFEGQGAMMLEAACQEESETQSVASLPTTQKWVNLPIRSNSQGLKEIDWEPLIPILLDPHQSVSTRARCFHQSLAQSLWNLARQIRTEYGMVQIGLSGGVFQNRILTEKVFSLLQNDGFKVFLGKQLPANDASLSFGQMIEMGAMAQEPKLKLWTPKPEAGVQSFYR